MADKNTDNSEFPEQTKAGRRIYFDSNPIDGLVLLNTHKFVHKTETRSTQSIIILHA